MNQNDEEEISDKDVLLALVEIEENFKNSVLVKHLVETYNNGQLTQKELLIYFVCMSAQVEAAPNKLKVAEFEQFRKIKERIAESLEISFDDEQIEASNNEILNRLFETDKFKTMIKALMHVHGIIKVIDFKQKLLSKLYCLNYESSEEQLCSTYFDLINDFMEIHPRLKESFESHKLELLAVEWNNSQESLKVNSKCKMSTNTLEQLFTERASRSVDVCKASYLPKLIFNQECFNDDVERYFLRKSN